MLKKKPTIKDLFVAVEKELARDTLRCMGLDEQKRTKAERERISKEFMYSQGAYDNCKQVAKILNIKYKFLY